MKKHPIDELFSSNLRNHSTAPSQRAAELFQQRLAQKKRPKGLIFAMPSKKYYWAAAASVLLVLSLGWFILQQDGQPISGLAQNTQEVAGQKAGTKELTKSNQRDNSAIATAPTEAGNTTPQLQLGNVTKNISKKAIAPVKNEQVTPQAETTEKETKPAFEPMILDEPIMDKLTVAVLNAEQEKKKELTKNRKGQNSDNTLFKNSVAETVIVISEIQPKEEQLFIPEISGDSRVTIAQATEMGRERQKADRSFIAKVFTEIKHLKHGERLDVAGLSEKSNNTFARSDEGFIANEKEELSYRINKLKEVFGKNESR